MGASRTPEGAAPPKRMTPLENVEACLYWAERDGKQMVEVPIDTLRELLSSLKLLVKAGG